jgi:hypothetical protein
MKRVLVVLTLFAFGSVRANATEPNESFAERTILPAGVFSVTDSLTAIDYDFPNTVLGSINFLGAIDRVNDDGGPYEPEGGSELLVVDMNSGFIEFSVTGSPDLGFGGGHNQTGYFEVIVDAYDIFDEYLTSFSEVRLLEPGVVHDFEFLVEDPFADNYDVYTAPAGAVGDIDFFTFSGLTAGSTFNVQTIDTDNENIDTYLGWFDSGGLLLDANDDIDPDNEIYQSQLTGIVPAGGQLTFAVTGFGDEDFDGQHDISGAYALELEIEAEALMGDYNADGNVDAADYVVFRKGLPSGTYATWRTHFGESNNGAGGTAVPEPSAIVLVGLLGIMILGVGSRNSGIFLACLPAAKNPRT